MNIIGPLNESQVEYIKPLNRKLEVYMVEVNSTIYDPKLSPGERFEKAWELKDQIEAILQKEKNPEVIAQYQDLLDKLNSTIITLRIDSILYKIQGLSDGTIRVASMDEKINELNKLSDSLTSDEKAKFQDLIDNAILTLTQDNLAPLPPLPRPFGF